MRPLISIERRRGTAVGFSDDRDTLYIWLSMIWMAILVIGTVYALFS